MCFFHAAMKDLTLASLLNRYSGHTPTLIGTHREYAVLCPLVQLPDGLHLLFEVRSSTVSQAGEVCFPGGRMESGETPTECALRETWEELHIPSSDVHVIGACDFICNQRNFLLRPILGLISPSGLERIAPSAAEVSEVFTVPLKFFQDTPPELWSYELVPQIPENFPYGEVGIPENYPWSHGHVELPIWHYQGHTIWGMTARIVRDLTQE